MNGESYSAEPPTKVFSAWDAMSYHAVSVVTRGLDGRKTQLTNVAKPTPTMSVVVGAGVFGAWTALHLPGANKACCSSMRTVRRTRALVPAASHGSSDGLRRGRIVYAMGDAFAGAVETSLCRRRARPLFFTKPASCWLASENDERFGSTTAVLKRKKVPFESLNSSAIEKRYPQFIPAQHVDAGIFETQQRRINGATGGRDHSASEAIKHGVEYRLAHVREPVSSHDSSPARKTPGNKCAGKPSAANQLR